jgi:hypothetical protein
MRDLYRMLLVAVVLGWPLTVSAARQQLATAKGGLFVHLGNEMAGPLTFAMSDQGEALVVDSTGCGYQLIVRSVTAVKPDSQTYNPAMPDWSDAAACVARHSLNRQAQLMCDRLLELGLTKIAVAESVAAMYRAATNVETARADSGEVNVRWRGWTNDDHFVVGRSSPRMSQAEGLAKWVKPIAGAINRGDVVLIGQDGLVDYHSGRFTNAIRQEIDDLRLGRNPTTRFIRNSSLKVLMLRPVPLSRIQVSEGQ